MKKITSIILIIFLSLQSFPSWSETLTSGDLVERNELYYKKFSNVPFTGEVATYWDNGQLFLFSNYKDGKLDGLGEWYNSDGQLFMRLNYKDGEKDGLWEYFNEDGSLKRTETWKNGEFKKFNFY